MQRFELSLNEYGTAKNWLWFFIWFGLGLIVYFLYSRKNSKLNAEKA